MITHTKRIASCHGFTQNALIEGRRPGRLTWDQESASVWSFGTWAGLGARFIGRACLASVAPELPAQGTDGCNDVPPPLEPGQRQLCPSPELGLLRAVKRLQAEFTGDLSFELLRVPSYPEHARGVVRHVKGGELEFVILNTWGGWHADVVPNSEPPRVVEHIHRRVRDALLRR